MPSCRYPITATWFSPSFPHPAHPLSLPLSVQSSPRSFLSLTCFYCRCHERDKFYHPQHHLTVHVVCPTFLDTVNNITASRIQTQDRQAKRERRLIIRRTIETLKNPTLKTSSVPSSRMSTLSSMGKLFRIIATLLISILMPKMLEDIPKIIETKPSPGHD